LAKTPLLQVRLRLLKQSRQQTFRRAPWTLPFRLLANGSSKAGSPWNTPGLLLLATRSITFKVRNITQGVDIVSKTIKTGVQAGATFPDADYVVVPTGYAGAVANDHLQIFLLIDVINSAGTLTLLNAWLTITPLRKS
jgi:hypothetical protein